MLIMLAEHDHTRRLCLRSPTWADIGSITEIHADPIANQYNPAGPTPPRRSRDMLAGWIVDWQTGVGYWCVRLVEEGPVVGMAGVRRCDGDDAFNLYYRFAPSSWGNGYATEVAQYAVHEVTADGPASVSALIRPANKGSIAVAQRIGLRLVEPVHGDLGDQLRYTTDGKSR